MLGLGKSGRGLGIALAGFLLFAVVVSGAPGQRTTADEMPTVDFSSATYSAVEGAVPATITVELSPEATETIRIEYATSDVTAMAGEDYADTSDTLTFEPGDTTKTFDVTILEDALNEDVEEIELTLTVTTGAANIGSNHPAKLTIEDNDPLPTIDFSSTNYGVGEGDGSMTIEVQLSPVSGQTVKVDYATSDVSAEAGKDYTTAADTLTFDPGDTAETFEVFINNDDLAEIDELIDLTLSSAVNATLGDKYEASLEIVDNDISGIVVSPTTLTVNEPNGTNPFNIRLNSEPSSQVTIALTTSNSQCSASPSSVMLTSGNWTAGVNVTVTAVDDDIDDGRQTCTVETGAASSVDGSYDGVDPAEVTVNVLNDDTAGVEVTPIQVEVTEGGAGDSYQIVLTSQPTHPVRVTVGTDNQVTANPRQLDFDQSNWDRAKNVAISAVDDSWAEGPHSSTIGHSVKSSDVKYDGLKPSNVNTSIQDNDGAQIIVDPTDLTISEPNGSGTFSIRLTSQPSSDVTISLNTSNQQCSVSDSSAVLDSANWSSGASVTVYAVDDTLQDGDQVCDVVTGDAISGDQTYDGRLVQNVTVTVLDDGDRQVFLPYVVAGWPPLPGMPELKPINNADGDGTYTVEWTAVSGADSYVLEETRDSAFATATEIYAGPSTTLNVSGQVTGRSYHRVKARNSWGEGAWSATQWADMVWEVEPNNQPVDANGPLVSGLTYHGQFPQNPNQGSVFDYYYFDVASAGQVKLWLRNIPEGRDYNLVLRDASQQLRGYSAWGSNSNEEIIVTLTQGRYYVQIWHYAGDGDSRAYDLRVLY